MPPRKRIPKNGVSSWSLNLSWFPERDLLAIVLPGAAKVCVLHLHCSSENDGNLAEHRHSDHHKSSDDSLAFKVGFPGNVLGAQDLGKPSQYLTQLPGRMTQRQSSRFPLIMTSIAPVLFPPANPIFCFITSRTTQTLCIPATL